MTAQTTSHIKRRPPWLILGLTALTVFGCRSFEPPKTYIFDKDKVVAQDFESVWTTLIQWFANDNKPIKTLDKSSGLISSELELESWQYRKYCDCGTPSGSETLSTPSAAFNVFVVRVGDSTRITVNTTYETEVAAVNYFNYKTTRFKRKCRSTGLLETEILDAVK